MKTGWSAYLSRLTLVSLASLALMAVTDRVQAQLLSATTTPAEQQYIDLIEQRQDSEGLTDPTLIEPLAALGEQYYQRKQFDYAAKAFAQARQIIRVNDGFDTTREIALLDSLIYTERARGNFADAWRYEQTLLQLAEKRVGSLESLSVFRNAAARRLDLRLNYLDGAHPPEIELGCYYGWSLFMSSLRVHGVMTSSTPIALRNCNAGERDTVSAALLIEARRYQMLGIETLLQNDAYASDDMWQIFTDMLWTSEVLQRKLLLFDDRPLQTMMTRLLTYEGSDPSIAVRRAQMLLQLADMKVVRARQADSYARYDEVLASYAQVYDVLRNVGVDATTLAAEFTPAVPVVLPSYMPNPLTAYAANNAGNYIDASFDVTNKGKSRRIKIMAVSEGTSRSEVRALKQLIERSSFRPALPEGSAPPTASFVIRYYVDAGATPRSEVSSLP